MKKAIFAGIAVLLALVVFSCNDTLPSGSEAMFTADGRPLLDLTINGDTSRALTNTLAIGGIDFYEVVFRDEPTGDIYRTSWTRGRTGRIRLPPGSYGLNARNAIMFAGNQRDNTLLAVGLLTHITNRDELIVVADNVDATKVVQVYTTGLTFTLLPLQTNVKPEADSTFQILNAKLGTNNYLNTDEYLPENFPLLREGVDRPTALFLIPKDRGNTGVGSHSRFNVRITNTGSRVISLAAGTRIEAEVGVAEVPFTAVVPIGGISIPVNSSAVVVFVADAVGVHVTTLANDFAAANITAGMPTIDIPEGVNYTATYVSAPNPTFVSGIDVEDPPERLAGVRATYSIGLPSFQPEGALAPLRFATNFGPGIFMAGRSLVDQTIVLTQFPFSNVVDVLITDPDWQILLH